MIASEGRRAPLWVTAAARVIQALPAGRYRAMNWVARRRVAPFWARLPDEAGGLLFRCDLRDPLMREVCMTGRYEPQETVLLQRLLGSGLTFVDVGANWGYFTLLAAHLVGTSGQVVSVEADPRACAALGRNIARNGLNQVALVEGAAGRCPGNATLTSYVPGSDELSNFGVMRVGMVPADVRRFDVETLALDEVLDALGVRRVHLLKMDVEGAEADALEGLHRRLSAALVDRIVLELHPALLAAQGRSVEAVLGPLHELGYRAWRIDHSPAAHRAAASGGLAMESLLLPLGPSDPLGEWPHVLLARADLEALPGRRGSTWAA